MSQLFEVKSVDRSFYESRIRTFLPEKIIDFHTHVWLESFWKKLFKNSEKSVEWPSRVARYNSAEDLIETYELMFPGKKVTPLIFGFPDREIDADISNTYISDSSSQYNFPSLMLSLPEWTPLEFESRLKQYGFKGCKPYLTFAPQYIPQKEIRIYDFLPHHQLEVLNRHRSVVLLHIPRDGRLKDPVNLAQILEIERLYPDIKLVIAHVGRAYCPEDVGNAFEVLAETRKTVFDFSANTNQFVFEQLIKAVGPERIVFGSDLPILRMRMKRICEKGNYVNIVPEGLYGDVSGDSHMREVAGAEAEKLTFFMYEELDAFRRAASETGLVNRNIEDIFYNNAAKILGLEEYV